MTQSTLCGGHDGLRRIYRLKDNRLLRRFPWKAEDRAPILEALGVAVVPEQINVRELRGREGLSQRDFARIYGLPFDSLRSWERGAKPTQSARAFLRLIEAHPHIVRRALGVKF
jgi:DNA-binding XRE family transcriptional regulator